MSAAVIPIVTELTVHGPETEWDYENCWRCNYDAHLCPGCGEWLHHGTDCCLRCVQEIRRGER
jgi:hypothetical protein